MKTDAINTIKLIHGVYNKGETFYRSFAYKCLHKGEDMNETCGLEDTILSISNRFYDLLKKLDKGKMIEFTYAYVDISDERIQAIAIVRRPDNFSRKIGKSIVEGKIKRYWLDRYDGVKQSCVFGSKEVISNDE